MRAATAGPVFLLVMLGTAMSCGGPGRQETGPPASTPGGGSGPAPAGAATSRPEGSGAGMAGAPSLEELRNMRYDLGDLGVVTLAGGAWEGEAAVEGGASRERVTFVRDFRIVGDVDGDGVPEAFVLLAWSGGGSGTYERLAAVARRGGTWRNVAVAELGDRVQVRDARIEGGRIVLDVLRAGEEDAMCCPGELATRSWTLAGDTLAEQPAAEPTGRLTLAVLAGVEWRLRYWTWDEPAPDDSGVTVRLEEDRFVGNGGCNRYATSVQEGSSPGDLTVGPVAGTRMACPDPAMAIEDRFLDRLGHVRKYGFLAGQLMLSWEKDGDGGVMLFDRAPAG